MKRYILLLTLIAWFSQSLHAQAPRLYSTGEGLISTRIEQIKFDKDGFLWVTTDQGLCRYEGQTFVTYKRQEGNPYALQENHVTSLYEDYNGMHWICASDGLYYLCRTENSLTRYVLDSAQMWISTSEARPHPIQEHTLLVGSYGMGVFVFDTEQRTVNRPATDQLRSLLHRHNCQHIWVDRHNRLWVFPPNGIECIDLKLMQAIELPELKDYNAEIVVQAMVEDSHNDRLYLATLSDGLLECDLSTLRIRQTDIPELKNLNMKALCLSPEGDLLLGTENQGLWRLRQGKTLEHITVDDCPVDLDRVKVHSIAYDDQQNLWLGIYQQGLLLIPSQKQLFSCHPIRTNGNQHNLGSVSSFAALSDGSRLYGLDGAGLMCEYPSGKTLHLDAHNSPLITNAVLSLASTQYNTAYVGTFNYGIYIFDGKSLRRDPHLQLLDKQSIMTMVYDSLTYNLYIGTNGDGIYSYQTQTHQLTRLSGEYHLLWIVSLALDKRHRLWASTEGSMVCFDMENGTRIVPKFRQAIRAYAYQEDPNGCIWIASNQGLLNYIPGMDSLRQVCVDGVPLKDDYAALLRSSDGKIWFTSNQGLHCYDPGKRVLIHYNDTEIASVGTFSYRSATMWPDGTLSFGGDNGALEFSADAVSAYQRPLPPIQFTRLWVNNKTTDYDPNLPADENILDQSLWKASRIHLPATSNNVSLSFAVREFSNPLGIRYSYYLEGYDKDWHEVLGQENTAVYSTLPWGNYTLHVKATMIQGNGSAQTQSNQIEIHIDAPWYASWWAILIYTALTLIIVVAIINFLRARAHQRRLIRRAEHNRQIKEAKLRMFTLVSHEIKTPLTLIISPLRRLIQRNNDNATQSVYEMMYRSSLRILMLITQQMDIRKIDNGQMHLHVREVQLRSFLSDIMLFFSNNALSRKIDFRLLLPDDEPEVTLCFDPDQLDKVFFNLLSNAFKYVNDTGQVLIKVFPDHQQRQVRIDIYNSGSRLDSDDSEMLFARFGRDGSESLGLSLANDLTELHHGHLTASNTNEGVTFSVTLLMGDSHFTAEEKKAIKRAPQSEQEQLELEARAIREDGSKETPDGKELIEMLSEELYEKQRMRERRSQLNLNIDEKPLTSADEKLLNRVAECINKNISDADFNVEDLAQQVGISRIHLNRKLKELIDTTPSTLIKNTRLKQGAFLLIQSNVSIAEVAYSVGFNSPAYFSANFTAYFKMTPKEFVNTYTEDRDNPELLKLLE
ncbi:MAG: helix-turn-helix domain-containing protein [Bacteroidales bacterium]|nr:helix-turn-helix domain-containing protein [Bacteroidales bacterium]